jgi:hypothetical protein
MNAEGKRYTIAQTAARLGISIAYLGILRSQGLIPLPEKHGRTNTYSEDLISKIPGILEERRLAGNKKRAISTALRWKDPTQREELTFLISKPKSRKPTNYSPEFLAHQGQLKRPEVQDAATKGQEEFLNDPVRAEHWINSLTVAANKPETKAAKSASMKKRMAEKKAELEKLQAAARRAQLTAILPDDWANKPLLYRIIATELFLKEYMSNKELAERLDTVRLHCPYGDTWLHALVGSKKQEARKRAVNVINEIRKWARRPGKIQGKVVSPNTASIPPQLPS